jgi:signal transduction histidine kinase
MMFVLSIVPGITVAQAGNANSDGKRVVNLNATDPYLPAFLALDGALRKAVQAQSRKPTEFYAETLDMHRFPRAQFDQELVALLRRKYAGLKVDVVVAAAPIALDFALRHRADIWPGAIIVFHSVSADFLRQHDLDPGTIGVPVQLEIGQTLDLALKLRPATRRLVVVSGTGDSDRNLLSLAKTSIERYAGKLDLQYLDGLGLEQTLAAVRPLPSDALVLYLTMFRDGDGTPHVPREVLKLIAAASRAPVFGIFETYLGHGIAAGSIVSYGEQGRRTGELVARVLNGEDPAAIGAQTPVAARCMADWRQLRHWGIEEARLPEDCDIRFRKVTTWDRYRSRFLAALAVILAQAAMIIVLILHRRRLRETQSTLHDEYERRKQAEITTSRMRERLSRFSKERSLGAMATTIAHEINQPLIAIQNYAQAAKRRLQDNLVEKTKLIELFGKIEGQAERAGAITQRVRSLVSRTDRRLIPTPLAPLIEEVIGLMQFDSVNRGCAIAYQTAADLPEVQADALQIQLVLVNLLQNAMKSISSADQYDRHVSVDAQPVNDQEVQISVTDRGPGVATDRFEDMFEPLHSATGSGMGMGLAICRDIIDAHGGRIWYEPNPAGGAIFRFTLRKAGQ